MRIGRALLAGVVAILLGPLAGVADAEPPDSAGAVQRGDVPAGFVYWSDGYLAMTYSADRVCAETEPPQLPGLIVSPGRGGTTELLHADVPVSVYEYPGPGGPDDPGGGFEMLISNCIAMAFGAEGIEPVATGTARLQAKFRTDRDEVVHSHNGLVGQVTFTDGSQRHLNTFAQVIYTDEGATLIDLRQLRVHLS